MTVSILYEDNHLLILDKPVGIPTQHHEGFMSSLEDEGKAYIREKYEKKGNIFLHAIFRLDTSASGIVVFAKTQKALSRLSLSIKNHAFEKEYEAIVNKAVPLGLLSTYLMHGDHKALIVDPSNPQGKKAELVIKSLDLLTPGRYLLRIQLLTGRYHQIRAQLSSIGAPILGDKKYGSTLFFKEKGIALHHISMSFPHPIGEKICTITSPNTLR
jgi:23S rRNA pseudouridine1911/1915/1917 synthase